MGRIELPIGYAQTPESHCLKSLIARSTFRGLLRLLVLEEAKAYHSHPNAKQDTAGDREMRTVMHGKVSCATHEEREGKTHDETPCFFWVALATEELCSE